MHFLTTHLLHKAVQRLQQAPLDVLGLQLTRLVQMLVELSEQLLKPRNYFCRIGQAIPRISVKLNDSLIF